ncbi:WD40/YVTN/BNR-like repeat-containing protein [Elongatibacter sediminis]|uniref:Sortilin N-terminal domain-containing protein n=1 Tax=Elongatibacter sediminis TaxID=3119006 RepID=A0AAW9RCG5_9GAMM
MKSFRLLQTTLLLSITFWALGTAAPARSLETGAVPASALEGLRYRMIGPMRGGRVSRVAGIEGDPATYYFGTPAGGVWKTTDGGVNWQPIFDDQPVSAIGDIAIAPSNPDILYVGTGDPKPRGNVARGNGVYSSRDGGRTWQHLGLDDTRHIGRVIVHPQDPDTVYVTALGHVFGPNEDRGVFRTRDGGRTWDKVLYVDDRTGAYDITFHPGDPDVLYATTWQMKRNPYELVSGGAGSGLFRSTDGGDSWERLQGNGLPGGVWGKSGVTVSPADPARVFAVIEAEQGGLYRSDDHGRTWRHVNGSRALWRRSWFFMDIIAHPTDADTVYVMNINLERSTDGGETFAPMSAHHVDHHDLWIDPGLPTRMISANDGGANVSFNAGTTWSRSDDNQPTGQFYRVTTDDRFPYRIYGGQQDWEIIAIASRGDWNGIGHRDWYPVGGCEMGWAAPDRRTHQYVYAGCTDGGVSRYDHGTQRNQSVDPWPETNIGHGAEAAEFRFQWTSPLLISPHDPGMLYSGSNRLFRSTDDGMSWALISPDLTRDDKSRQKPSGGPINRDNVGTEVYNTIYALAESPVEQGAIWVGSDDGLVHLTRDGGESWTDITPDDGLLPEWSKINSVEASPHDAGTAYLAVQRRDHDDYRPYVYRTTDHGKTWRKIVEGLPGDTFARVVREDPVRPGLLYLGTETGIFVSFDGGARWQPLQRNLPVTPIYDLTVHEDDLVVATHGRAFWVLDDIGPLRQMSNDALRSRVHLFNPAVALRVRDDYVAPTSPVGENPPPGAVIYYRLDDNVSGPVTLSILDRDGKLVNRFSSEKQESAGAAFRTTADADGESATHAVAQTIETSPFPEKEDTGAAYSRSTAVGTGGGLHRFVWDLRYPGALGVPGRVSFWHRPKTPPVGPLAVPGRYQVRLEAGGEVMTAPLVIESDPRIEERPGELHEQLQFHLQIRDQLTDVSDGILTVRHVRGQLEALAGLDAVTQGQTGLTEIIETVQARLTDVEYALTEPRMEGPADAFHYPIRLDNKLGILMGTVANSDRAPTRQSYAVYEKLQGQIHEQLDILDRLLENDVRELDRLLLQMELPGLDVSRPQ